MKQFKIFTTMLVMSVLFCSMSTVAFAGGGSEYDETPPVVVTPKEETAPLTPEGNLTLVDDITTTDETDKQFITAVSKNGNYFYLVIDRAGDSDNVYLLNMIDEADLISLMKGEPDKIEEKPTIQEPVPTPTEPTEEPTDDKTDEPKSNTLPLLVLVLAMCGGGAFYYLKFVKGKNTHKGSTNLNELSDDEYSDDEEEYQLDEDDSYLADEENTDYREE